jgi:hypothetical protein
MAAQKRSSNRNYIDLVEDGGNERRGADLAPASVRPIKDYLLSLVAAMRTARNEAR